MREFFTMQALIMFVLGVLTSAMVKSLLGRAKSTVAGG